MIFQQAPTEGDGDVIGVERALDREQPFAALVLLADAERLVRRAVKLLAQLHFDERALLLDDHDEIEAAREFAQALRLERPGRGDLVKAQAQVIGLHLVDAEIVHRLPHVEIGLADGDDADLGTRAARGDVPVQAIGAQESEHRVALALLQPLFLRQHRIAGANIEATQRHGEILRRDRAHAIEQAVDRGRQLHRILQEL